MKWHYDVVDKFFEKYYSRLLTENMISGDEMFLGDVKDDMGEPKPVNEFFYPLKKGKYQYLIPSVYINKLPIMVDKSVKVSHKGKAYFLCEDITSAKIRAEKRMSFREFVDDFANTPHSSPEDDLLYKIIVLVSVMNRINVRVASPHEFGKDSKVNLIAYLTGDVGMVSNPTIAKLEYMLFNKLLCLNEVSGITGQSVDDMQNFLLATGDFKNKYTKRSRAGTVSREEYNIHNLSLLIAYNDLDSYSSKSAKEKYFDFLFKNNVAVNSRFIPFLFSGKQTADYEQVFDRDEAVAEYWEEFVDFLRTLKYFKEHPMADASYFSTPTTKDIASKLEGRWSRTFNTISSFINKYAEDEAEYEKLIVALYKRHIDYLNMVESTPSFSCNDNMIEIEKKEDLVVEEEVVGDIAMKREEVLDFIRKRDIGDGVFTNIILHNCKIPESELNRMVLLGDIYQNQKRGYWSVLE